MSSDRFLDKKNWQISDRLTGGSRSKIDEDIVQTKSDEKWIQSKTMYTRGPLAPNQLLDEVLDELATLKYLKYSSTILVERKSSGKLLLSEEIQRMNHSFLILLTIRSYQLQDKRYKDSSRREKVFFAKPDCRQAYHVLKKMADLLSIQLLSFNNSSRIVAFLRLAQRSSVIRLVQKAC